MKQNDFASRNKPENLETASQQIHRERMERLVKRNERAAKKVSRFRVASRQALNRTAPVRKSWWTRFRQGWIRLWQK